MEGWDAIALWLGRALSYLVIVLSSLSAMILIAAAAPGFLRRQRTAARSGMRRCFLWGLVFLINAILVAALLSLLGGTIGKLLALAILVGVLVISLSGLSAITCEVGQRVLILAARRQSSVLFRIVAGSLVLFVTAIIPVFGWLVFTGALLTGIGAFLEAALEDYAGTGRKAPMPREALARSDG